MGWQSLGTLTLGYDWQSFGIEAIDSETFRVLQSSRDIAMGYATLCQFFPFGGRATYRRIYPADEPNIIQLRIPVDLRQQYIVTRTIQAKLNTRARTLADWQIEVQVFY